MSAVEDPPARGTRPRNRRDIIIRVGGELFYRHGYANVSVTDVAHAVNVGHSALYRHFRTKSELLTAAIRNGTMPFRVLLASEPASSGSAVNRLDDVLDEMAVIALEHREIGVLWQREARNLDADDQRLLREELREMTAGLSSILRANRPELGADTSDFLSWCLVSALVSVGFHSLSLPRSSYQELLVSIARTIAELPWPDGTVSSRGPSAKAEDGGTRRNQLLSVATELFAARGFGAVTIDEIGEAAGIAGPSIYSFFASKQEILAGSIHAANDLLQADVTAILARQSAPSDTLVALVESFVHLAVTNRFALGLALSELDRLDAAEREYGRRQQRDYIDTWTRLLVAARGFDETTARIRVQAVLLVVNDAVQTPHLRARPDFEATMCRLAVAVLGIESAGAGR